jgi:signal transduction histidine kinase
MNLRSPTLFWKISGVFLLLLVLLGTAQLVLTLQSARSFVHETDQKLNLTLATDLAERFAPFFTDGLDYDGISHAFKDLMVMNPRVELYMLDQEGSVIAYFAEPEKIKRMSVDLGPVLAFTDEAQPPLLGDDPRSEDRQKPFSAAPVQIGDESGFLYVILGGEQYDSVSGMVAGSSIIRTGLLVVSLALLLTATAGLILFFIVTQRLHGITETVSRFQHGDINARSKVVTRDEIGQLGIAFNEMADTIVTNMQELERSDQLRRELVANVSHDLRSPLASIQGYVETVIMKNGAIEPQQRRELLEVIYQNAMRLSRLVDELFELSKLDAQQTQPNVEPFSMAELIQDVVLKFKPQAGQRDITLEDRLPRGLFLVEGDVGMIERVLSNLLDNAIRYTPEGGTVSVELENGNDRVSVRVADSGPGIPAEDLPHIFDRFYRVEKSRSPEGGGSGLGLAIARRIIELHGSLIEAESEEGVGTAFTFQLPLHSLPARRQDQP